MTKLGAATLVKVVLRVCFPRWRYDGALIFQDNKRVNGSGLGLVESEHVAVFVFLRCRSVPFPVKDCSGAAPKSLTNEPTTHDVSQSKRVTLYPPTKLPLF